MQVEVKGRLDPQNTSYHSLHNLVFPLLLHKDIKVKTYGNTILPVVYGCKTWSLRWGKQRWWSFKRRVLRKMFGPKTEQQRLEKTAQ